MPVICNVGRKRRGMNISSIEGKIFKGKATKRKYYGRIKKIPDFISPTFPKDDGWNPFAEDENQNYFVISLRGQIGFWDHETELVEIIAKSFNDFVMCCIDLEDFLKLNPSILGV